MSSRETEQPTPLSILQQVFGFDAFRPAQERVIADVIAGHDAFVLMPTGGGKSLCYQIPALLRRGVGIVVSPLIALMKDQVDALLASGIAAACYNSSLGADDARRVLAKLHRGELDLLYVSPEKLLSGGFLERLGEVEISLFAIDESHCVSQWGHDFRPEYAALGRLRERFADVPILALTATADKQTRVDILRVLHLEHARLHSSGFDRPNIRYAVLQKHKPAEQLQAFLRGRAGQSGIVYALSRRRVDEIAQRLIDEGVAAAAYHAGLGAATRSRVQDAFLRDEVRVVVATVAFGMGIDKPNVRFVVHYDLPKNIEGYYQETGRAGRDGEPAQAWMAYSLQDVVNQRRMIDESQAGDEFKQVLRGKLDALLALAEATDCRRVRLLGYFGETSQPCGNCDNCLNPPQTFDATEAARKVLSCIYRVQQAGGSAFGAGHIIDILRGKPTEKVEQHGHQALSTFGIGADLGESEWRGLLRQLIAREAVWVDGAHFNTLRLGEAARAILKGEEQVAMRVPSATGARRGRQAPRQRLVASEASLPLLARETLAALKAWRGEVAREHNLPAYVIFHDATLRAIAERQPSTPDDLHGIAGLGQKKLEAYGAEVLRVVATALRGGAG